MAIDDHVNMIKTIRTSLFVNDASMDNPAQEVYAALAVYEFALKVEGVGEIKETLSAFTPLFTAFVEGLQEAAAADKKK